MNCSEAEIYYSAHLDGELEGTLRDRFERHLEHCQHCRQEIRELKAALRSLRQLPEVPASPQFAEGVVESLRGNSIPVIDLVQKFPVWITGRAVAAAAVLLLVFSIGFGLARILSAPSVSEEEVLERYKLRKMGEQVVALSDALKLKEGLLPVDGEWLTREEAVLKLMSAKGYRQDRDHYFVPRDVADKKEKGLVPHKGAWRSPEEIVELVMKSRGLVKHENSWITPEMKVNIEQRKVMLDHNYVFVGDKWISPDEYESELLAKWNLVEVEGGGYARKEDIEKERLEYIKVNERWVKPDEFVSLWMEKAGYAMSGDGRWVDKSKGGGGQLAKAPTISPWRALPDNPDLIKVSQARALAQDTYLGKLRRMNVRGRTRGGTDLTRFHPLHGAKAWRVKLKGTNAGQALGTPAFAGDRVFIGGGMGSHVAYAFGADTGNLAWAMRLSDNGPSNPVVLDDQVYYATESCTLYSLDARTGRSKWARYLAGSLHSMPMAGDGNVLMAFPADGYALAAFGAKHGKVQWHAPLPGDSFTAPCVSRDRAYVTTRAGTVHCYSLRRGGLVWAKDLHAMAAPTVIDARQILVRRAVRLDEPPDPEYYDYNAVYGEVSSIVDASSGEVIEPAVGEAKRLTATALNELFPDRPLSTPRTAGRGDRNGDEKIKSGRVGPVAVKGSLAFSTRGNVLEAVDLVSGKRVWSLALAREGNPALKIGGTYRTHSDPCVAGNKVFVGTLEGRLYCVNADTGRPDWVEDLESPIGNYATPGLTMMQVQPIVAYGRVYVTSLQGELICYDTGNRNLDGPHMWGDQSKRRWGHGAPGR